jgi:hypothetical protein
VLDLGASSLKALLMNDGKVAHHVSVERPDDAQLASAVKTLLADPQFKRVPVHLLVTDSRLRVYTLRFANSRDRVERQSAQQQALDEAVGRLGSEMEIRALPVQDDAVVEQLAVTLPRSAVAAASRLVKPATVSANGVHAAQLVGNVEQARALVDIGAANTVVTIVESGIVRRVRVLPVGGRDFTRALVGADRDEQAAEQAKIEGRIDATEDGRALQVVADDLLQQVSSALDEYRLQGGDIKRVLLTGGGSRLRGLVESFDALLGVRCRVLDLAEESGVSHEEAAAWAYALALNSLSAREIEAQADFRPAKRSRGGDTVALAPGFVIDRKDTASGRRYSLIGPIIVTLAAVALVAGSWFVLDNLAGSALADSERAQRETRQLARDVEIVAPADLLRANTQALDLVDANARQARMMSAVGRLEDELASRDLKVESWNQQGYAQLTLEGTGVLPADLGDRALAEIASPARIVDVKQSERKFAITIGVPA